jgi:hypothetical protein
MKAESAKAMARAVSTLNLKNNDTGKVTTALSLYVNAVMNKYLEEYKEKPGEFFENTDKIKMEIKEYIGFILNGIARGD